MTLTELVQGVQRLLAGEGSDEAHLLAREALRLTDMIGWATGLIDPQSKIDDRLELLQQRLRARHTAQPQDEIAILHDALGDLRNAIARHDRDLGGESDDDHTVDT